MNRIALRLLGVLLLLGGVTAGSVASAGEKAAAPRSAGRLRVEVRDVKVAEAAKGSVALDVTWGYIEQDNLRPSTVSIIAILIGLRGKEYTGSFDVTVPSSGPLPTSGRVVINHEEQITGPQTLEFAVTVAPKVQVGTGSAVVGKKTVKLRVTPAG